MDRFLDDRDPRHERVKPSMSPHSQEVGITRSKIFRAILKSYLTL